MKSERKMLIAFILNLLFCVLEYAGAFFTGSVAIWSDAVHDFGDAVSIGIACVLERISKRQPDEKHTYGYARYSVFGGVITTLILLLGSCAVIYNAVGKIIVPGEIDYDTMIIFALIGLAVNFFAVLITRRGQTVNQKAVNLHMTEDVLGWAVVLVGAIVMRSTDFVLLDPIMSIAVALFIVYRAVINLKEAIDLFLEKTPRGISVEKIKNRVTMLDGVLEVHHVHVWSLDGQKNYATMHIVIGGDADLVKNAVRTELKALGIAHVTLETEKVCEHCHYKLCDAKMTNTHAHHHHHH